MVKSESKLVSKKNKIGILGGSFDPAHKGHLTISKEAIKRFDLRNVIWAITKKNPFKKKSNINLLERIKVCKKIIEKTNYIKIKFYENIIKSNKTINLINYLSKSKKNEIPVSLCGEMAGDPNYTKLLLGMGLKSFSMHPSALPEVKNIMLSTDVLKIKKLTSQIINCDTSSEKSKLLKRLNKTN